MQIRPGIETAVRAEEARAEKLSSLIQAALLALLAGLYFAAPKAFAGQVPFEPVPLVLAVYAPFVALRLLLAWRGRVTEFLAAVSVVVDIGVLLALIFSFHLQYGQPAPFYLKAPTFAYFFIFIALRALRYDWRYVMFAGALAATGWLGLLAFAALQPGVELTRSFSDYIFGMKILIGAEIDKVVTLLAVSAILAVAVARSRRLLEQSAADAVARRDLSRFFSPDVAEHILSTQSLSAGEAVLRDASILTADLRGFTPFARSHPPRTVMATLAEYQHAIVPAVFRHHGVIDKFLGDGILVHFGAARPDPVNAANCLRAAEECLRGARAWNRRREAAGQPAMGVGIACAGGELLFGVVGDTDRLELTVIGDPVNLAAKLEKHTKTLDRPIVTTRAHFDCALRQGYAPACEPEFHPGQPVAGASEALDLVSLDVPDLDVPD